MNDNLVPLLPKTSLEYFSDASNENYKLYLRVTSIRNCLENILHTVLIHIINHEKKINIKSWKRKKLEIKINDLKSFLPKEVFEDLHEIRKYSNLGTHELSHSKLDELITNNILEKLKQVCEWTIYSYFEKYGFNVNSWIPTLFSTLPPKYRINILEKYYSSLEKNYIRLRFYQKQIDFYERIREKLFEICLMESNTNIIEKLNNYKQNPLSEIIFELIEEKIFNVGAIKLRNRLILIEKYFSKSLKECSTILLVIEKLSMAYLKNYEIEKSFTFLKNCYEQKFISDLFYFQMKDKLKSLENEIENLNISKNISDTNKAISTIFESIKEEEESLFSILLVAIIMEA